MGEWSDQWASEQAPNLGARSRMVEMQSEGGAAGGNSWQLQTGALATTFTASQGLMLMLPNMYKIAGELTPCVIHVAARSLAAQGLSIFCDHSDVMAARATGFALLSSASVQEAADFAVISHAATLESRIPFLHFFDGFRTSHEIQSIKPPTRGPTSRNDPRQPDPGSSQTCSIWPDHPVLHSTRKSDVYFQARETVNPFYLACPTIVQNMMDQWATLTGRSYHLFDYLGDPDAEHVIVVMGSAGEVTAEAVDALNAQGYRVGVLKVRLYRPFAVDHFLRVLPKSVKTLIVLDRTKEPGCVGEPLYLEILGSAERCRGRSASRLGGSVWPLPRKNSTQPSCEASSTKPESRTPKTISPSESSMTSPTPA